MNGKKLKQRAEISVLIGKIAISEINLAQRRNQGAILVINESVFYPVSFQSLQEHPVKFGKKTGNNFSVQLQHPSCEECKKLNECELLRKGQRGIKRNIHLR